MRFLGYLPCELSLCCNDGDKSVRKHVQFKGVSGYEDEPEVSLKFQITSKQTEGER